MDITNFLTAFQGPYARTNETLQHLDLWDQSVMKRLLNFVDVTHKVGFDIYQTDNDDYRIGKKDLHKSRGNVLCVLSFSAIGPTLARKPEYYPQPLNDEDLDQFSDRNNAILMNRGGAAAELFLMERKPHWPNQYNLLPVSTKTKEK